MDDHVKVTLTLDASKARVRSCETMVLTPSVKAGTHRHRFPPIAIEGRNHKRSSERARAFGARRLFPRPQITIRAGDKGNNNSITYTAQVAFAEWMKDAELELCQGVHGCARSIVDTACYLLGDNLIGDPLYNLIVPEVEEIKNRDRTGKAFLEFPAGEATILPRFRRNQQELNKINRAITQLNSNPDAIVTGITLRGFASPEGSFALNKSLSERRTQALRVYLQRQHRISSDMFEVNAEGEDWVGLRQLVMASRMNDRDKRAIVAIIDTRVDPDVKEQRLKQLQGGAQWNEMFNRFFPQLRRVDYALHHTIRPFTVEEGKEKIKVSPEEMSLNEMFMVANSYGVGNPEFKKVFEIAVRVFPQDTIANINVAAVALGQKDLRTARRHLAPYTDVPKAWNNLGMLYMLEGKYPQAHEYLTKAKEQNTAEEAAKNLVLLNKWMKKE